MIGRRGMIAGGAALAMLPRAARALQPTPDFSWRHGTREQGCLMVGNASAGATITLDGKPLHVSSDGWFGFGIAYDRKEPIDCLIELASGKKLREVVEPVVRQYDIQSITGLPEKYVEPPPEVAARMKREHELIWTAREADTDGIGFSEPLDWPFAGRLSGVFGSQRILNGKPMSAHLGVDIAAPEGTPIHAPADGIVSITDEFYLEGGFTLLDHGHGVSTCCLHQSKRLVTAGQSVKRGEVIGHVGMTGRATGPHTHWGLCWFQMKLDPSRATATPEPPKA